MSMEVPSLGTRWYQYLITRLAVNAMAMAIMYYANYANIVCYANMLAC